MPQFLPIMLFLDSSIFTYYAYQYVPIIRYILTSMVIVLQKTEASM